jgi:hypothetical protein
MLIAEIPNGTRLISFGTRISGLQKPNLVTYISPEFKSVQMYLWSKQNYINLFSFRFPEYKSSICSTNAEKLSRANKNEKRYLVFDSKHNQKKC